MLPEKITPRNQKQICPEQYNSVVRKCCQDKQNTEKEIQKTYLQEKSKGLRHQILMSGAKSLKHILERKK
jgi:hypothetical protein